MDQLEKELSNFMSATKALTFDFARLSYYPYDDSYYDAIEEYNALLGSQLKKEPVDDPLEYEEPIEQEPTEEEPKDRYLLSVFFSEDHVLQRLEFVIWPNKVLPLKIQTHSWTILPIIEDWAFQNVMSFKSLFQALAKK